MAESDRRSARVLHYTTGRRAGSMKDAAARQAVLSTLGLGVRPAFLLRQVHGTGIVAVRDAEAPAIAPEADGLLTELPGILLCVFVADCVPLFLWEKTGKAAGVFHAGWRGAADGMPRAAVKAFGEHYGIKPEDLRFRIGPHIRKCCFRVGPETAERFRPASRIRRDGGLFVDLDGEVRAQLEESGVPDAAVVRLPRECTGCESEMFFSYRHEKTDSRMMAFITIDS